MSSTRQQIVDALEARLKTITSIGGKVFVWRKSPVTVAETPCLLVADLTAECSDDGDTIGSRLHTLTVEILAVTSSKTSASQARNLLTDIFSAIGSDNSFGGLALYSDPVAHEINTETDGDITAAVKVAMQVAYRTSTWGV